MRGFTLLEMLVALAIAGIVIGLATLQLMPDEQSVLHTESERMAFLMENGSRSMQSGGQPLAWSGYGNSYRFWKRTREGDWVHIEHDRLLHPRTLPGDIRIGEVSFDGRAVEPGSLVILSPELSAKKFRIHLLAKHLYADIVGNGLGKVTVEQGRQP